MTECKLQKYKEQESKKQKCKMLKIKAIINLE